MPRRLRVFIPGLSQHVVQRGNNRIDMFRIDDDYKRYLMLLRYAASAYRVAVHAYVLMTNHVHLLMTPPSRRALSRTMQDLGRAYVQTFNEKYGRSGTLLQGRFRSNLVADERYFHTCHRYIEMNPVRAAMVDRAEAYRWSSYRFYALGEEDPVLAPHPLSLTLGTTPVDRQLAWRATCGAPLCDHELAEMRQPTRVVRSSSQLPESPRLGI